MPEPKSKPSDDDDDRPKQYRITKKRLGTIRFVDPSGEFGFIEAEDFREDVFFHYSVWQWDFVGKEAPKGPLSGRQVRMPDRRDQRGPRRDHDRSEQRPSRLVPEEIVTKHVEFEIDDDVFEKEKRLRATVVRPTRRPMGRKLTGRDATFKIVTHHPKARRKRPDWRG